jgi:NDP-sugar pyrophosphorylase family protein
MAIKKVVIAAAGQGTRMLHLSKDKPKHLIMVNDRPFLAYLLDSLFLAGYRDVILVGGYIQELMEEFTKSYAPPEEKGFKIKFVNQFDCFDPKEAYGTACPLMCVKNELEEQFLYICGDNLFSVNDLKAMNMDDKYCYVAGLLNDHPEKYGVLVPDGEDFLDKIIEKPKEFVGNLINAGLYKFTPDVFEKLSQITKSPRGEYEVTDVVSLLAKDKKVKIKKIKDFWKDFGNPDDVIKVSEFLKGNASAKDK